MEFNDDTLFEGVLVRTGDSTGRPIGEVLIYEQDGYIGVVVPSDALVQVGTATRHRPVYPV